MRQSLRQMCIQLRDHWLAAEPIEPGVHCWHDIASVTGQILAESTVAAECTGTSDQPYEDVESLRYACSQGTVRYRAVVHPLGMAYNLYRVAHDIRNHYHQGKCFGIMGELRSAADLIRYAESTGYLRSDYLVNLIMSDVVAPNAAYFADGGWKDAYDYTKVVTWPRALVCSVLEYDVNNS